MCDTVPGVSVQITCQSAVGAMAIDDKDDMQRVKMNGWV
jgi:hypothetical protein